MTKPPSQLTVRECGDEAVTPAAHARDLDMRRDEIRGMEGGEENGGHSTAEPGEAAAASKDGGP